MRCDPVGMEQEHLALRSPESNSRVNNVCVCFAQGSLRVTGVWLLGLAILGPVPKVSALPTLSLSSGRAEETTIREAKEANVLAIAEEFASRGQHLLLA